jgi:hypothetical protein
VAAQQIKVYNQLASFWADSIHQQEIYIFYTSRSAKLVNSEKNLTFAAQLMLADLRNESDPAKRGWKAEQAIELFEQAIQLNPNNANLQVGLGSCYVFGKGMVGNPQETMKGIQQLLQVVRKDSLNMQAQLVLGIGGVISNQFDKAIAAAKAEAEIEVVTLGQAATTFTGVTPTLLTVKADAVLHSNFQIEEIFGPSSIIIVAKDVSQMEELAHFFSGHLTASLFGLNAGKPAQVRLLNVLTQKVGRLIVDGFPTGVEVCHSMVHGGPFPSTTVAGSTSVGTSAIYRFTRPLCFQGFPHHLLPDELQNDNPLGIMRRIDGKYTA